MDGFVRWLNLGVDTEVDFVSSRRILKTLQKFSEIFRLFTKANNHSYFLELYAALLHKGFFLQAHTLPHKTPPIGKIQQFSKMAITFEPKL